MEASNLKVFIQNTLDYFKKVTEREATAGVPRTLNDEEEILLGITGAIGIAGDLQGAVYITGQEEFYRDILIAFNPGAEATRENILDVAGELANTIAGNAQEVFGAGFRISVPMIISGESQRIRMKEPRFLIPVAWSGHDFYMVIGINDAN